MSPGPGQDRAEAQPLRQSNRRIGLEALLAAALIGAAHLALGPDPVESLGVLYDDTVYLALGKAIAEGDGFRSIHMVGAPVQAKFPPGLPLLYSLAWLGCGALACVARAASLMSVAATAACAGLLWWYSRAALGNGRATTLALVIAPLVLRHAVRYLDGAVSEPWFMLGWVASLVLADRVAHGEHPARRTALAVGLGLTMAAATLVRTQAMLLSPAVLAALALTRATRRAAAVAALAAGAPLLAWRAWHGWMLARGPVATQPDQVPYTEWIPRESAGQLLAFARSVVTTNASEYGSMVSYILLGDTTRAGLLLTAAMIALGVVGAVALRARAPALPLSLAAMLVVIVLWPFNQSRFLVPLFPFAGLAVAHAIERALAPRPAPLRVAAAGALLLLVSTFELGRPPTPARATSNFSRAQYERGLAVSAWIARNTPPDARILVDRGSLIYLRTGRRTAVAWPEEPSVKFRSVFVPAGRYHASRIVADSVDFVVAWGPRERAMLGHLAVINARCPGVLVPLGASAFRVERGRVGCLAAR